MSREDSAESGRAIKQGAVLYDTRGNTSLEPVSDRGLCHVVSVFEEVGTGDRLFNVWDGTHTYQEFVHEDRLLEDFEPAGWTFPRGKKPLYHLTRNCGVEDPADLMTDGGEETPHGVEAMNQYRELGEAARTLRENALEADDRVDEMKWIAGGGLGTAPAERLKELAQAIQKNAETLEELAEEAPAPREVRDDGE